MLLTSHYMRDVEALCSRVLVIAAGQLIYDGPLAGITEQLRPAQARKLQFAGDDAPTDLAAVRRMHHHRPRSPS